MSYQQAFGKPSGYIHLDVGGYGSDASYEVVCLQRGQITALLPQCLFRCASLIGMQSTGGIISEIVQPLINKMNTDGGYEQLAGSNIKKGDFVLVFGKLCEVIGFNESDFGYKSFNVRYLSESSTSQEDWFAAINVHKILDGEELRESVRKIFDKLGIASPGSDLISQKMREQALALWEQGGMKECLYGDYVEGERKRLAFAENSKSALDEQLGQRRTLEAKETKAKRRKKD